jgi:hypothetical protein
MLGEKTATGKLVKLICSLFLAATVLSPLVNVRLGELEDTRFLNMEDSTYVTEGKQMAKDAMTDIIKSRLETYISHEAESVSANLTVEVTLSGDDSYLPQKVALKGAVSPYQKKVLSEYMENTLGISRENQIWI